MGLGQLLGPIIGTILYSFGGYLLPFIAVAGMYLILYPFLVKEIQKLPDEEEI